MLFNIPALQFSVLVVRPRHRFFEWLRVVAQRQGIAMENLYFPEQDGVWLIPAMGTFNDSGHLTRYVQNLKPVILEHELAQFGPLPEEIPGPWSKELCDEFFDIELRERAYTIEKSAQGVQKQKND